MPIDDRAIISEHIIEIRYRALGRVVDIRGLIADRVSQGLGLAHWSITENRVDFKVSETSEREAAFVSHRNLGYVVRRPDTRHFFVDRTMRFIRELLSLNDFQLRAIKRFGVRAKLLYPYQGQFETLLHRVTEIMPLHQNYTQPFNALVEDVGPVIVLRRQDLQIKVQSGPMKREQAKILLQGEEDLPDVGFYLDLDLNKIDLGEMHERDVGSTLRSMYEQVWTTSDFYNRLLF